MLLSAGPVAKPDDACAEPPEVLSAAGCPSRLLLDQIADKWSILILAALCRQPLRFNALRRHLEGVTQKALTDALRRLERNGIVARRVVLASPVAVEYSVTPLGRTLKEPFGSLHAWTLEHCAEVERARSRYDAEVGAARREGAPIGTEVVG